ncbi:DUF2252 family protein [Sphingomonas profundi]|uniref:DUF2252 family protein n=1 Tax=Alterirhizorhabdus profundi TaxID=2681549 RepID=UPI0012E8A335|nr:DUF2252 family protein [Sphingomonas profundi]
MIVIAFDASMDAYEAWLRARLGEDLREDDLAEKHRKMAKGPFAFLRATYWRWAETILEICPDLAEAPAVLAIGDIHLENFGTWRDAEGRLVWGVNDFDEAATMPAVLDPLRLAVSAMLAGKVPAETVCDAIAAGYAAGLEAPGATVLESGQGWLRKALLPPEEERDGFWTKLAAPAEAIPPAYAAALRDALPPDATDVRTFPRSAGTGSLGRPRFVALATWRNGPVAREAKAMLPPAWSLHHGGAAAIRAGEIAAGRYRAPDPCYRTGAGDGIATRRLSPDSRKIEAKGDPERFLARDMLVAMGHDIASCHAGDAGALAAVREDWRGRPRGWLAAAATIAARAVTRDQDAFEHACGRGRR